jgi:hypothetical protein
MPRPSAEGADVGYSTHWSPGGKAHAVANTDAATSPRPPLPSVWASGHGGRALPGNPGHTPEGGLYVRDT